MPALPGCYDDAALVAFPPDGSRAEFLCARMIQHLARSVEEIIRGCSSHLEFEKSVARLSERLRASSRVPPELYCIYFDLLKAVRRDNLEACGRLLREMDTRMDAPLPSFYSRWGGLPELTARRYVAYVNVDPTTQINFQATKRLYGNDDAPPMAPYAPRVCYNGRRSELKALLRRVVSPVTDIRDPIQLVHDRIAARASSLESACRLTNASIA